MEIFVRAYGDNNADGDHGYATTDFRALGPADGTLDDFDELLRRAPAWSIGVIMDYVINHSAREHPMFVSALNQGPRSPFYDWYVWETVSPPGWHIWEHDPRTRTPRGSYLRFWLNRGLDGFRLDSVHHLVENSATDWNDQPESHPIASELRALITAYPQVYAAPDICASAFAFGLERNIINAAKGGAKSIQAVADHFTTAPQSMATFAANHDIFTIFLLASACGARSRATLPTGLPG